MVADPQTFTPSEHGFHSVGSSDVPVILGVAPWKDASVMKTWAELAGLIPYRAGQSNRSQLIGKRLEYTVLGMYADTAGCYVEPQDVSYHVMMPWAHTTPDARACSLADHAWMVEHGGTDPRYSWPVEAKVSLRDAVWDEPPVYYAAQCMWHNIHTAAPACHLAAFFVDRYDFKVYTVPRADDLERRLLDQIWRWYERYVINREVPEPDDSATAARTLARVHRSLTRERGEVADWRDIQTVRRLHDVREELQRLKAEEEQLKNNLRRRLVLADRKTLQHPSGRKLAGFTKDGKFLISKQRSRG